MPQLGATKPGAAEPTTKRRSPQPVMGRLKGQPNPNLERLMALDCGENETRTTRGPLALGPRARAPEIRQNRTNPLRAEVRLWTVEKGAFESLWYLEGYAVGPL